MRLLYFAPHAPWPLTTGARLRNYHLARQLGAHCSVSFVGLQAPSDQASPDPPADSDFERSITLTRGKSYTPANIVRGLLGPTPVTLLNYFHRDAADELSKLIDHWKIDALQLEGVHLMPYLPFIRRTRQNPKVLVDWHNIESELMYRFAAGATAPLRRLAAKRTAGLIETKEDELLASCPVHTVTSDRERTQLLRRSPSADIQVIPNGVDVGFFSDYAGSAPGRSELSSPGPAILFVGSMDYHANVDAVVWFAEKIWPAFKKRCPGARFFVVGRDPAPQVRGLAGADITITGTVEDVRPWYAGAAAVVVPIRTGSGTRLKILEAMAAGVPVVSTRLGAEGLEVENGAEVLLADSEAEITRALGEVVSSPELARQLSESARKVVAARYDWRTSGRRLYRIYCEMLSPAGKPEIAG